MQSYFTKAVQDPALENVLHQPARMRSSLLSEFGPPTRPKRSRPARGQSGSRCRTWERGSGQVCLHRSCPDRTAAITTHPQPCEWSACCYVCQHSAQAPSHRHAEICEIFASRSKRANMSRRCPAALPSTHARSCSGCWWRWRLEATHQGRSAAPTQPHCLCRISACRSRHRAASAGPRRCLAESLVERWRRLRAARTSPCCRGEGICALC
mmetsp:Transcript_47902/g.121547  ORF Transcript_47902/g.121547 Transcript_47902/m.121547 type:complete len:211 (+) Transcript_47902:176-808(+)